MKETKSRIISLKKEMLYTKDLQEKFETTFKGSSSFLLSDNFVNSTFRQDDYTDNKLMNESLLLTSNTDASKLDTAKSTKTVRFDGGNDLEVTSEEKYLEKYAKLNKLVNETIKSGDFLNATSSSVLNLSLPPTPRKIDQPELATFKSLESLERQSNLEFIQE